MRKRMVCAASNSAARRTWAGGGWLHLAIALLALGVVLSPSAPGAATALRRDAAATPMPRAFLPLVLGLDIAPLLQHDWQFAEQQILATTQAISTTSYPFMTDPSGKWATAGPESWTSGFFPGSLWLLYEHSPDPAWRSHAQSWQAGLESQKNVTTTHDLGFMLFNSFGHGYRLTGDAAYRQVLLTAAESLATRYSPAVGCIESLDGRPNEFRVIIDNMVNLELLFWASKHGGQPAWYTMAVSHALKTRQEHVRADGSTFHQVIYNPTTGAVQSKGTVQGYRDDSTWSRGQAWAIYGFTLTYRETGDARFLATARATADYFLSHLPADHVPYWDFQAPGIPNEPRDSSAAATAASGLIELSQLEPNPARQQRYLDGARKILVALSRPPYLAEGTANSAVLLHGTINKPAGAYDSGLIWGDYYLLEALLRYQKLTAARSAGQR
jgi:unsaturated chondroitin disaccharide hydrolase